MENKYQIQRFISSTTGESISIHHEKTNTIFYVNVDSLGHAFTIELPHDEMLKALARFRSDVQKAKRRHTNNLKKRDQHRNSLCGGCRHNYYNFQKEQDSVGVGVSEDYYCWHMENVNRGKCSVHSGNAYR